MFLRIIGVIIVIFCSGYYGFLLKMNYKKRITYLERLLLHLEEIKGNVEYLNADISQIIDRLPKESIYHSFFGQVSTLLKEGQPLNLAWKKAMGLQLENSVLQKNELEIIYEIGEQLGSSNRETQIKQLEFFQRKIMKLHETMKMDEREKSKLYTSLGIMSGIFISIVLI